jgi:hypothetical protein
VSPVSANAASESVEVASHCSSASGGDLTIATSHNKLLQGWVGGQIESSALVSHMYVCRVRIYHAFPTVTFFLFTNDN